MGRLDLDHEVNSAAGESFAVGVGFHALVDGLKHNPRRTDAFDAFVLNQIVDSSSDVVSGLHDAGVYMDPRSATSGARPTWAL